MYHRMQLYHSMPPNSEKLPYICGRTDINIARTVFITVGSIGNLHGYLDEFPRAAVHKVLQTEWLNEQKWTVSQSWRWEVQIEGFSRIGSFWGLSHAFLASDVAGNLWHFFCLRRSIFLHHMVFCHVLVCLSVQISPCYRGIKRTGSQPTLMISSELG